MPCDKKITPSGLCDAAEELWHKKHGPLFETLEERCYPRCMDKDECILVKSYSTDWVGHIRICDIDIEEYYRTPCTSAVLKFLGVKDWEESAYTRDCTDILKKNGWIVEIFGVQSNTMGALRVELRHFAVTSKAEYYMVIVLGHVLLLNNRGTTVCDTDPRERDGRRVYGVYKIIPKEREGFTSNLAYRLNQLKGG